MPATPPQPFQVDNIADVWTVLSASGSLIAAVGTVAAFWLAAVAYRRQVNDRIVEHASKVTFYRAARTGTVHVENLGDLPVYNIAILSQGRPNGPIVVVKDGTRLSRGEQIQAPVRSGMISKPSCIWAHFTDSSGVRWNRYLDGTLKYEGQNKS